MAKAHGAAITDAEIRDEASICVEEMYYPLEKLQTKELSIPAFHFIIKRSTGCRTPNEMNAPITLPAMVANPPVMTA